MQAATIGATRNNSVLPAAVYTDANFPANEKVVLHGWTTQTSKRTTLYATHVWTNNDRNSIAAGPNGSASLGARDEQNQTFLVGVNHTF